MEGTNKNSVVDNSHTILELYKLHVEMADRVSHRRGVANNLFIAIHTSIISASGLAIKYFEEFKIPLLIVMVLGIMLAFIWKELILSYKKLNSAKFKVINKIEKDYFPVQPYVDEYNYYKEDKRKDFSKIEKAIPITLFLVYGIAIIVVAFRFFCY